MKKVLLALAILAFASPLFAADAYVAVFTDADHQVCSLTLPPPGGFLPFDTWVWFFTPNIGVQAAEYKLTAPAGVIVSTPTKNPDITASLGDAVTGISVSFGNCQNGWVWTERFACYLTITTPAYLMIDPRPEVGLQIASCELGYPIYPATVLNHLALNQACLVAVEDASWGAIKSLY